MAIPIYLDNEGLLMYKEVRKKDPNFNASFLFREALKKRYHYGGKLDVNEIRRQMEEIDSKIEILNKEKEILLNLEKRAIIQEELARKELEDIEKAKEENKKKEEIIEKSIKETFEEEAGYKMTDELYNDYKSGESKNIYAFVDNLIKVKNDT